MAKPNNTKSSTQSKSKNKVKVDFTDVQGSVLIPEGDYRARVGEITVEESDNGKYLKWVFRTIDDDKKLNDKPVYYNTSLLPQALWNLRNVLETLGVDVPDGPLEIDLEELIDLECIISVVWEKYEGKNKAKIADIQPLSSRDGDAEVQDDEDTSDDNSDDGGDDTEVEGITEAEVNDMDSDELGEVNEKYELGVDLSKIKLSKKQRAAILDALEKKGLLKADE
jgi:hypothetical protein